MSIAAPRSTYAPPPHNFSTICDPPKRRAVISAQRPVSAAPSAGSRRPPAPCLPSDYTSAAPAPSWCLYGDPSQTRRRRTGLHKTGITRRHPAAVGGAGRRRSVGVGGILLCPDLTPVHCPAPGWSTPQFILPSLPSLFSLLSANLGPT